MALPRSHSCPPAAAEVAKRPEAYGKTIKKHALREAEQQPKTQSLRLLAKEASEEIASVSQKSLERA